MQQKQKVGLTFIISSVFLIVVVLAFTGGLNIASFQENYAKSLVSTYNVVGSQSVNKIEYAVRYGKKLDDFYGAEELLAEIIEQAPDIKEVRIVLEDGKVMYNQEGVVNNEKITSDILNNSLTLSQGEYHSFLPILDKEGRKIGGLVLSFNEEIVSSQVNANIQKLVMGLVVLALIAALILRFYFLKRPIFDEKGQIKSKEIIIVMLVVLTLVQVIFGFINYRLFNTSYTEVAEKNIGLASDIIQKDLQSIADQGVPFAKFYYIEDYLEEIRSAVPEIAEISMNDSAGKVMYTTTDTEQNDRAQIYTREVDEEARDNSMTLNVKLSSQYIGDKMKNIILDMVTILVTSFIFLVEMVIFMIMFLNFISKKVDNNKAPSSNDLGVIRPLTFLLFMAVFMSATFIPVVMKQLYEPLLGLPKNVVLGLPISAEMLAAGLATVVAGYLLGRTTWKQVFLVGVIFVSTGTLLAGIAQGPLTFIIARGVVGIGYGFSLMALRGLIVAVAPTEQEQGDAMAKLFAGLYAGMNCGVIVGAMLAERIGYSKVFFTAMGLMIYSAIFVLIFMNNLVTQKTQPVNLDGSKMNLLKFFGNRQILTFFVLIVIPTAITGMFLDYYFPLFAESTGASTSDVGRAFLLNGLFIVYLGPFFSKYSGKYLSSKQAIVLASVIIVVAMFAFSIQGTLLAAYATVILLGLSDSIGLVAQNKYYMNLEATKRLGIEKAIGYQDNIRKVGQMIGPVIFGSAIALGLTGVGLIGLSFLVAIIFFVFWNRKDQSTVSQKKGIL